jgi:hypothetical protein
MKTLVITLIASIIGTWAANSQTDTVNYVVTPTDTIFCGDMNIGAVKTRIELEDGTKLKIDNKDLVRYSKDGRFFQKLPVYVRNQKTDRTAMMELVQFKNLVKVFKEERYDITRDAVDAYFYFYYKGECIQVDRNPSLANIVDFVDEFEYTDYIPEERNLAKQ